MASRDEPGARTGGRAEWLFGRSEPSAHEVALAVVAHLVRDYAAVVTDVDIRGSGNGTITVRLPPLLLQRA